MSKAQFRYVCVSKEERRASMEPRAVENSGLSALIKLTEDLINKHFLRTK